MHEPTTGINSAFSCPTPWGRHSHIVMGHGGGGQLSRELIEHVFVPALDNVFLRELGDAAVLPAAGQRIAVSTDSYVVRPLFFPGGNIADLAVNGTVNDLAMRGAIPKYLTIGCILEEGFPLADLQRIAASLGAAARQADVLIVAGDTKVVERGHGDGCYLNSTGIGLVAEDVDLRPQRIQPGDVVFLSGTIGDHGLAILSVREGFRFESPIVSDTTPLTPLVATLLPFGSDLRMLRDATRGGIAATLNEIAVALGLGIEIDEAAVPIAPAVRAACEMLGLDAWEMANEGKFIGIVAADRADEVRSRLRDLPLGQHANVIGRVTTDHPQRVIARTDWGTAREVPLPYGEQLPRIC